MAAKNNRPEMTKNTRPTLWWELFPPTENNAIKLPARIGPIILEKLNVDV